jgi:acyl carrier protein
MYASCNVILAFINEELLDGQGLDLSEATPLFSLGVLDSFALLSLVAFLDRRYNITLNLGSLALQDLDTVSKIVFTVDRAINYSIDSSGRTNAYKVSP